MVGIPLIEKKIQMLKFLCLRIKNVKGSSSFNSLLPDCYFMCSWRYRSHIQDFQFMFFWRGCFQIQYQISISCFSLEYWSHIQVLQEFITHLFSVFGGPPFPNNSRFGVLGRRPIFKMIWDLSWIILNNLVFPNPSWIIIDFGSRGHVRQVRQSWKWKVFRFPKVK